MDRFDNYIKNRVASEEWKVPEGLDNRINNTLNNLSQKKVYKKTSLKILLPAAIIVVLTTTTVFAMNSPSVKNTINNVISYFSAKSDSKYISDKQNMEKFNNAVGVTTEDKGIKFTVDNIAVDDNFLNVFYTIESDKPIPRDKDEVFSAFLAAPFLDFKIDGRAVDMINNNDVDACFESEYKLRAMRRGNISKMNLDDNFELEISTDEIFNTPGNWKISTVVDKSPVKADTNTVTPKQKATVVIDNVKHNITIDKVSISPFGSQMLISEWVPLGKHFFGIFALFDEKGNSLDVLNTDHTQQSIGKTTNAFEFIKADKNMEYITLVPIKMSSDNVPKPMPDPIGDINKLPVEMKVGKYGSVIVDNIVFTQNQIKITYHKEGVTLFDPAFLFYDKDGKEVELGDLALETSTDRVSGKYTQVLTAYKSKMDFSIIASEIAKISTFADEDNELLYDQQIRIDLKK